MPSEVGPMWGRYLAVSHTWEQGTGQNGRGQNCQRTGTRVLDKAALLSASPVFLCCAGPRAGQAPLLLLPAFAHVDPRTLG